VRRADSRWALLHISSLSFSPLAKSLRCVGRPAWNLRDGQ